uniref:SCAN box domain-containing protein n=1 Tax=Xenopus tropicalis TaxID=8364 RepID=A0A1B8XZV3_XENTR
MDRYRSRLETLGADLTGAERLKLLELTIQESQGRASHHSSHSAQVHHGGPGREAHNPVVRLTHAAFPTFDERKENIDAFLRTFEIMCEDYEVPRTEWTKILVGKLTGKANDVYREMPYPQRTDYEEVNWVLLNNYAISPESYRHSFRTLNKVSSDTYWDFGNRLRRTFDQWVTTSQVKTFEELRQLCLQEQFFEKCSPEVRGWVWDRSPKTMEEAAKFADKCIEGQIQARRGRPSSLPPTAPVCSGD